ncbi:hypothetical protein ZWY2020_029336 [Hordeum vulgare]|nr:hypothetical protein ZWY2020_029336 [Hordeum vulgare]
MACIKSAKLGAAPRRPTSPPGTMSGVDMQFSRRPTSRSSASTSIRLPDLPFLARGASPTASTPLWSLAPTATPSPRPLGELSGSVAVWNPPR